jgi:hypothetical protein
MPVFSPFARHPQICDERIMLAALPQQAQRAPGLKGGRSVTHALRERL